MLKWPSRPWPFPDVSPAQLVDGAIDYLAGSISEKLPNVTLSRSKPNNPVDGKEIRYLHLSDPTVFFWDNPRQHVKISVSFHYTWDHWDFRVYHTEDPGIVSAIRDKPKFRLTLTDEDDHTRPSMEDTLSKIADAAIEIFYMEKI